MNVLFPALITRVNTTRDNSIVIKLETQELSPDKMSELMRLHKNICYCMLKSVSIDNKDMEIIEQIELGGSEISFKSPKTSSQKLRNVLYLLWKQTENKNLNFDEFYSYNMEEIINSFKTKLNSNNE